MRFTAFILFVLLFSCSLLSHADVALVGPKTKTLPPVTVSQNSPSLLYSELLAIQKQFTALEVKLEQQNDTLAVKALEDELSVLKTDLIKLQELVAAHEQLRTSELKNVDSRINDLNFNTNMWGTVLSVFGLIITIAAIWMGWSTVRKAEKEARKAAKIASNDWFEAHQEELISPVSIEVSSVRKDFDLYIKKYDSQLKKLESEHEQYLSDIRSNLLEDKASAAEKQEFIDNQSSIPELESSLKDYFDAGYTALAKDDLSTAIKYWKYVAFGEHADKNNPLITDAMFNLGVVYEKDNQPKKAIDTYQRVITQFSKHDNEEIQLTVAQTMINLGITYGQENQPKEEIEIYQRLITQFSKYDNEEIQLRVARAMFNLGITYKQDKQLTAAIDTYKCLIAQFSKHDHEEIQLTVAQAMVNLGITYGQVKEFEKGILMLEQMIQQFSAFESEDIQQQVANAKANVAEVSIVIEQPNSVISRIELVESQSKDEQTLLAMTLFRFMLNNVEFSRVMESIQALSDEVELTWGFDEIKDYINEKFSGLKRQQIDAVVDYIENHKDKDTFLAAVKGLEE